MLVTCSDCLQTFEEHLCHIEGKWICDACWAKRRGEEAVSGPPFDQIGSEIAALVRRKQEEYGDTIARSERIINELYPDGFPSSQQKYAWIIIRMIDKLCRIAAGCKGDENPFVDLAGYCFLVLAREKELK